nr:MAG TPA: hypothetical protein [Caudoviricetes sp.]
MTATNTNSTTRMMNVWGEETNPFANGDLCNNGGGYFNPAGGAVWSTPVGDVIVDWYDDNCGDFGARWDAMITVAATGHEWRFSLDRVGRDSDDDERWNVAAAKGLYDATGLDADELLFVTSRAVAWAARMNWGMER